MSLILEALKKSEAQRRLGEMPGLGTPITATRRRRSPMPWLAFVAVVALAAAGGWRYLRHHAATAPAAGEAAPSAKAVPKSESALPPPVTPRPSSRAATAPAPATQQITSIPPPPAPAPPPKRETAPPAQTPALPAASTPAPTPPAVATRTPTPAPEVPAVAAPPPAPAAPPPAAPAPPANDVPSLDDLPPEVRRSVPDLPITMQVYSPDPKRRFVVIEGTRVVEGDSLRGVTVQEIRPNGLVIEFQGRRVLIPRPGS